jgi:hypothetical protein
LAVSTPSEGCQREYSTRACVVWVPWRVRSAKQPRGMDMSRQGVRLNSTVSLTGDGRVRHAVGSGGEATDVPSQHDVSLEKSSNIKARPGHEAPIYSLRTRARTNAGTWRIQDTGNRTKCMLKGERKVPHAQGRRTGRNGLSHGPQLRRPRSIGVRPGVSLSERRDGAVGLGVETRRSGGLAVARRERVVGLVKVAEGGEASAGSLMYVYCR